MAFTTTLRPPVGEIDHQTGNLNSKVTLVEYGDYQCPYCRRAHPFVQQLLNDLGGELRFVFRHFPLKEIHNQAFSAALSAEAAARQGRFWGMHDLLFQNQNRFREENLFLELASQLELDIDLFMIDLKSEELAAKVERDFSSGIFSGVNRTPTFFLNEVKIYTYEGTYESLLASIELPV